jgi:hypothetical protein
MIFSRQPQWAYAMEARITQQMKESIMAAVEVDQTALDTLATNLEAAKTSLAARRSRACKHSSRPPTCRG